MQSVILKSTIYLQNHVSFPYPWIHLASGHSVVLILFVFDRYTAKIGIGIGAIYVTATQGVWSNTSEGSEAADKIKGRVLPQQSATEQVLYMT